MRVSLHDSLRCTDHLLEFSADDSLHLEEELELEAIKEQNLRLPREKWALGDLKRSLLLVSDDNWFQEGGGMIDLKILGPNRPSTFKKVFSDVPGAIYGCLKVWYVVGETFRMVCHFFNTIDGCSKKEEEMCFVDPGSYYFWNEFRRIVLPSS